MVHEFHPVVQLQLRKAQKELGDRVCAKKKAMVFPPANPADVAEFWAVAPRLPDGFYQGKRVLSAHAQQRVARTLRY